MKSPAYEKPAVLAEYLAFHYLEPSDLLPAGVRVPQGVKNFPSACAHLLVSQAGRRPRQALDLGCGVGRATFELARRVPRVVGVDFSRSFVRASRILQRSGRLPFQILLEGNLRTSTIAKVPRGIDRRRVRFLPGDALHIPSTWGTFDLVLAANLIDRLTNPDRFLLQALPKLVNPGGLVLLTSPYTWSTDFTPRNRWLRDSFTQMKRLLCPNFQLLHRQDLPFLIREHRRKFQYTFADATLWQRSKASA